MSSSTQPVAQGHTCAFKMRGYLGSQTEPSLCARGRIGGLAQAAGRPNPPRCRGRACSPSRAARNKTSEYEFGAAVCSCSSPAVCMHVCVCACVWGMAVTPGPACPGGVLCGTRSSAPQVGSALRSLVLFSGRRAPCSVCRGAFANPAHVAEGPARRNPPEDRGPRTGHLKEHF